MSGRVRLTAAAVALALAAPAIAQDVERGIRVEPDDDLAEQLAPEATMDKSIVLPPAPALTSARTLAGVPTIALRGIEIDNGSILSDAEVGAVAAGFVNRNVSIEELEELRRRLSLLYFDKGYVNSGLVLPDQQILDSTVRFREIRGELTAIQLSGNDKLRDEYIMKRIRRPGSGPLEINELQESLQLLEQDPMIGRINAQLLPGAIPGQGILKLDIAESRRWQFVTRADNHRSPAVGGEQLSLLARNRSLTRRGDELTLYGSYADGYGDGFLSYSLPVNSLGTSVRVYGSTSDSDIVEEPFDAIDISSKTTGYGMTLGQDFHRSLASAISGFLGMEVKHNENTLLGQPFSFTDGERNGETDVAVVYLGVELAKRFENSISAMRASFRRGVFRAGATQNRIGFGQQNLGPDGQFTSFVFQGQHIRSLDLWDATFITRLTYQRAWHPLLSMEKLPMGGANTVRGHRENLLVRDNGVIASVEWQFPLFDVDGGGTDFDRRRLKLATFFDFGESWNNTWENGPSTSKEQISSVGLGLLWDPSPELGAELYWGNAIKELAGGGGDLQDDGIHFSFRWTPWN